MKDCSLLSGTGDNKEQKRRVKRKSKGCGAVTGWKATGFGYCVLYRELRSRGFVQTVLNLYLNTIKDYIKLIWFWECRKKRR